MSRRILTITLLLAVSATHALSPVAAQGPDQDEAWRHEPRDLSFSAGTDGFSAESTRDTERGEDEFSLRFDLAEGRLVTRFVSTEPQNESVLTLGLALRSVVEFSDENADGRYGFGDRVIQRIPLEAMQADRVTSEPRIAGGHVATATYAFPRPDDGNGSFPIGGGDPELLPRTLTMRFLIVPAPQQVGDVVLAPLDTKVDLVVDRFPFQETDTRLAVETHVTSSEMLGPSPEAERTLVGQKGPFGTFLRWSDTARVDGALQPVHATEQSAASGADGMILAFAYARGDAVTHDATMGYTRTEAQIAQVLERLVAGDWLLYTLGFAVTLAVVGVPAAKRLRDA